MLSAEVENLLAVSSDADDFNVRFSVKELSQRLADEGFVIGDQHPDALHRIITTFNIALSPPSMVMVFEEYCKGQMSRISASSFSGLQERMSDGSDIQSNFFSNRFNFFSGQSFPHLHLNP
jgi:hypothetical protein